MPGNAFSPIAALLCEFDARAWSGTTVFTRGGNNVALPSFGTSEGIYDDVLDLLNGNGAPKNEDLQTDIAAVGTGAGAWTIELTSDDKVKISNDTESFDITAHADNATFGFDTAGESSAGNVITASLDWMRGRVEDKRLTIDPATGAAFSIPSDRVWSQSVITMLRTHDASDADGGHDTGGTFESLQAADCTAAGATDIRWGVSAAGKVWWAAPSSASYAKALWSDTDFRDALGFSGSETVQTDGSVDYQVADYHCPYVYVPTRCPQEIVSGIITEGSAIRLTDGGFASSLVGTYERTRVRFYVDGPADSRSTYRNWIRFLERCVPGRRVALYQEWGDPRRALYSHAVTSSQDAYDLLYTSEQDGRRGRIRGRWSADNETEHWMRWPRGRMRRIEVEAIIEHAED